MVRSNVKHEFCLTHLSVFRAKQYGLTYKVFILHKAVVFTANPAGVKVSLVISASQVPRQVLTCGNIFGIVKLQNIEFEWM